MNIEENFLVLKLDVLKRVIDLQDPAILRRLLEILREVDATPMEEIEDS